jgi:hypothetical protein
MPRLTSRDYFTHRQFLREEWDERDGAASADLPYQQQLDLHDYFAPSAVFTEREALTHRSEMTKAFPSLPQKAGRACEAMCAAIQGTPNQIVDTHRDKTTTIEMIAGKRRLLRITGVARPKIDHYRLARALLNLEREMTSTASCSRRRRRFVPGAHRDFLRGALDLISMPSRWRARSTAPCEIPCFSLSSATVIPAS